MSVILLIVVVVLVIYVVQAKYRLVIVGSRLAGPWAVPLLGNLQMITKLKPESLLRTFIENRLKYRQTYRLWVGPQLWVFLHSPDETKEALNDPTLVKAETFNQLSLLIGNGLLISHGKYWHKHRSALEPAFYPNILNSFGAAISEHADLFVKRLTDLQAQPVEVTDYLFPCILDAIIDTSMGTRLKSQMDAQSGYARAFHTASEVLFKRMVNPLLMPDFVFKRTQLWVRLQKSLDVIHGLMDTVIAERKEFLSSIEPGEQALQQSLLDILLNTEVDGWPLSLQEIRDEVNTFVFAGVDTTTAAMAFVLYALAKYPEEQVKVRAEVEALESDFYGTEKNTVYFHQLSRLEYLDMFLKECLRFYTIVPVTGRQTTVETTIGDRTYCAGTNIWINMYGLAHDPELFESPEQFRPQRFSSANATEIPSYSFLPFSGGPHVCIGRRYAMLIMKIMTAKILKSLEIGLKDPEEVLVLMAQMVLKSRNGINLTFRSREL